MSTLSPTLVAAAISSSAATGGSVVVVVWGSLVVGAGAVVVVAASSARADEPLFPHAPTAIERASAAARSIAVRVGGSVVVVADRDIGLSRRWLWLTARPSMAAVTNAPIQR